jgi:hypothetical protein
MARVTRRPTQLETPPPGTRCPACWHQILGLQARAVSICPCCYVIVFCITPGQVMQRLVPADLRALSLNDRCRLSADQAQLIMLASNAWRAAPRPPRPRLQVR